MSHSSEFFDEKLQDPQPPDPKNINVTPPQKHGFTDIASVRRKILATRKKVDRFLRRYWRKN